MNPSHLDPYPEWTPEQLKLFTIKMQSRIARILTKYKMDNIERAAWKKWPQDDFIVSNLYGEMIFAFNVIGDAALRGIGRPDANMSLLNHLWEAFEHKIDRDWEALVNARARFIWLYSDYEDVPDLPFPEWWNDLVVQECDLSTWIALQPSPEDLEKEVHTIVKEITELVTGIEGEMDYAHRYVEAAAEDMQESARDWVAAHSAMRSQAGLKTMGLPLTPRFA